MSAPADKRTELRDALVDAGFANAHSTIPEKASPPIVFVAPGDPYLTPKGATFGGLTAQHRVIVVAGKGVNETQADALDQMLQDAVLAIDGLVDTFEVDEPGTVSLNGQKYLGAVIRTQTEIRFN